MAHQAEDGEFQLTEEAFAEYMATVKASHLFNFF